MHKISGLVIHGDGYGSKIGFPTVNLEFQGVDLPKAGVYAGDALVDNKKYRAGIVIGPGLKVEAHLLNFNRDIYGKEMTLEVKKFLRDYKKFKTEQELIAQIKKDLQAVAR